MDPGCTNGGILKLRELIEEHPAELAYDFRSRFGISYRNIGDQVSWLEAVYLVAVLLRDPGSWLQAVKNEWDYPVSREWLVSAHTYDLHAAVNTKKPKPYPTPWPDANSQRLRSKKPQERTSVIDRLAKMNPKENDG